MIVTSELSQTILLETSIPADQLAQSPLATNGMKLLEYADRRGGIPLTKAMGNFDRHCVEWAANEFQWPGYEPTELYAVNKVLNEPDFPPLFGLHSMLMNARLMRHLKGRAVLTKAGTKILGLGGELQAKLFDRAFFDSDPWGDDLRVVEGGLWDITHIINVALSRLHDWVSLDVFTALCVPVDVFPTTGPLGAKHNAALYVSLHAVRPLKWLGLVEEYAHVDQRLALGERKLRKTSLFDRSVRITIPVVGSASLH